MGGKTKKTQRTKNNAKPSSSSRSAELLGVPTFVGFSAHSDLGLVPVAPGFSNMEQIADALAANIDAQTQMIIRKMSKKDPLTRKKALQEFIDHINLSEVDSVKSLLPLWPKYYHNLANDYEHVVRELSQTVLQLLVSKCKRLIAPYLKQLIPVWLASQYDSYAPAASIARKSFRETFVGPGKHTEVCLHCQTEIMEYTIQNLTFHSAATLSLGKTCTPEEAEQKYLHVVTSSLKLLSFFVENTLSVEDMSAVEKNFETLVAAPKFWSFVKNKVPSIKAAWFELIYYLLQHKSLVEILSPYKVQLITVCFKNIEEGDPLVGSHIWSCILLVQTTYDDWYTHINFKETVLPKFLALLRKGCNNNAEVICPHLLPFLSKITQECLQDINLYDFYKNFFDIMKQNICTLDNSSKSEISIMIKAYFEWLRLIIQRMNNKSDRPEEDESLAIHLLKENVIEPLIWFLSNQKANTKTFFQNLSALIAFWADRKNDEKDLYAKLLNNFWIEIFKIMTTGIEKADSEEFYLDRVVDILHSLYSANPSLEEQKVKFSEAAETQPITKNTNAEQNEKSPSAGFIQKELKDLVVELIKFYLKNLKKKSIKYVDQVQHLMKMYTDIDFYASISDKKNIKATLNLFLKLIEDNCENEAECETLLDIVFEMLQHVEKKLWFEFIDTQLFGLSHLQVQVLVLQRLLSYPFCVKPEVRTLLAKPFVNKVIVHVTHEVVTTNSTTNLNLLHKCFFQNDAGEILISRTTVDEILKVLIEALNTEETNDFVDDCASFIAQIMPVICNNENSSKATQNEVFLKLFKFSIEHAGSNFISEDTIWEITTCWQDALASGDIVISQEMLKECAAVIEKHMKTKTITIEALEAMSESISKFVLCLTEKIVNDVEKLYTTDVIMIALFTSNSLSESIINHVEEYCIFLEGLKGIATPAHEFSQIGTKFPDFKPIFRRAKLNFSAIYKIMRVVNTDIPKRPADLNDVENIYKPYDVLLKKNSDYLMTQIEKYINIASIGECLIENACVDIEVETLILECIEHIKQFMINFGDVVDILKYRLMQTAAHQLSVTSCRSLKFLRHATYYSQFDESGNMILIEEILEFFIGQTALQAYVVTLQYFLPILQPKATTTQSSIMSTEPEEMWVRAAIIRCLILNNFSSKYNEITDKNVIKLTLNFMSQMNERIARDKSSLLYHVEIHKQPHCTVIDTVEYINLIIEVLNKFPYSLTIKYWDNIRIGISSWALSISKSIEHYSDPKASLFIVRLFKLFAVVMNFINAEKQKSSTDMLKNVIEEWENLFAREVNLVLFKVFYTLCNMETQKNTCNFECFVAIIEEIAPTMELIDYSFVYTFYKSYKNVTLDNIMNFLLKNLSNPMHNLRMASVFIIRKLTKFFVAQDVVTFEKDCDKLQRSQEPAKWHYLNRFEDYIGRYSLPIKKYIQEFSFKLTEISELQPIDPNEAMSYLLLWDCIVYICGHSPVALRAVYTGWLNQSKYEESFLLFLFRAMPAEILKNYDSKVMTNDMFNNLDWNQLRERQLSLERYVCYLYTEVLRKLPAEVRKWWNTCLSRQKTFIDKLTTNYVSQMIVNEELKAISNKKDKHENMQVTVHQSTREVMAAYTIDEARIELVITLAKNYPLGGVKVECGKQIGGRASARNFGMQLTIFLIHQNGTIFDGLTLWKKNLDKKFEGVEECYVCYTVIHQDTCQLPKLTCKTCKKKFHGPCLYKWFTTSSKSTCPICRNIF